jgi:hypothetical protein
MPGRIHLALQGNLRTWVARELKAMQRAVDQAVREAGDALRADAKAHVSQVFGPRLGNAAFRHPVFYSDTPKGQIGARVYIGSRIPEIIVPHEESARIRPSTRKRLAIPLPGGPARARGHFARKKLTPESYQQAFGVRLVPVPIGRGRVLLIDPEASATGTMSRGRRRFSRNPRARKKGLAVFMLIDEVFLPKRLRLRDLEARAADGLGARIEAKINATPQPRIAA